MGSGEDILFHPIIIITISSASQIFYLSLLSLSLGSHGIHSPYTIYIIHTVHRCTGLHILYYLISTSCHTLSFSLPSTHESLYLPLFDPKAIFNFNSLVVLSCSRLYRGLTNLSPHLSLATAQSTCISLTFLHVLFCISSVCKHASSSVFSSFALELT